MKKIVLVLSVITIALIIIGVYINMKPKILPIKTSDYLMSLKIPYIGDNSAVGKILDSLNLRVHGRYTFELQTKEKPYILTINYSSVEGWGNILDYPDLIKEKSAILLTLIENADEIQWIAPDTEPIKINTSDLVSEFGNIKDYSQSQGSFKNLLVKLGYYNDLADKSIVMEISNVTKFELTLKIKNKTNKDFQYGMSYYLEQYKNNNWETVKNENCDFTMQAIQLKSNEEIQTNINLKSCYGKLNKGQYRIVKEFNQGTIDIKNNEFTKNYLISVEFIIK